MSEPGMKQLERALREGALVGDEEAGASASRFAERAEAEGLVEVAYGTLDTPLGEMLVAGTREGLVRVALPSETFDDVLVRLSARVSPRIIELPGAVDEARRELDQYFAGTRREFELSLDRRLIRGTFTQRVLEAMGGVPFGEAITYTQAAERAGNVRAMRAAGNALGSNPIPIVIPCHRVVRTGGDPGNYGGGPEMKRYLLRHEGWLD